MKPLCPTCYNFRVIWRVDSKAVSREEACPACVRAPRESAKTLAARFARMFKENMEAVTFRPDRSSR